MKLQKVILIFSLVFLLSGCTLFIKPSATYLTSKDKTWIIPKNIAFQAIGNDGELKSYKVADDLLVIYKGRYLEVEKAADMKVLKAQKKGNQKALFSGIGTLAGAAFAAFIAIKRKKKK